MTLWAWLFGHRHDWDVWLHMACIVRQCSRCGALHPGDLKTAHFLEEEEQNRE